MNKEEDYASDSDQSDEDFCPEKGAELTGESEGPSEEDDSTDDETDEESQPKTKRGKKSTNTKSKRSGKAADESRDEAAPGPDGQRRSTRQMENTKDATTKVQREKEELSSDDEDQSHKEALWADFLGGVAQKPTPANVNTKDTKPPTATVNTNDTDRNSTIKANTNGTSSKTEEQQPAAHSKPLSRPNDEIPLQKPANGHSIKENKVDKPIVTPLRSPATSTGLKRPAPGASGGLSSFLSKVNNKKNKLSVLEKSKQDWNSFKQTEGIHEQIQTYNKGKDGYLERQDFLQRTDLRQFELEKSLRQSRRNN